MRAVGLLFIVSVSLLMWVGLFAMGSAFFAWLWRMIPLGGF